MPPIELFRAKYSTNSERVALALAHKGLEAESHYIEYSDRSEVERVSGQGLVPVLVDRETVVADSMTIVAYLEGRVPEPALYPADPTARAEMDVFIDWFNRVWKLPPNQIAAELAKPAPDREAIAGWAADLTRAMDLFERLLSGRDYLLGSEFSAADVAAFPFLKYALARDPDDDEDAFHLVLDEYQSLGDDHERLRDWIERVDKRPRV